MSHFFYCLPKRKSCSFEGELNKNKKRKEKKRGILNSILFPVFPDLDRLITFPVWGKAIVLSRPFQAIYNRMFVPLCILLSDCKKQYLSTFLVDY